MDRRGAGKRREAFTPAVWGLASPAVTSCKLFGGDSVTSSAHVLKESGHRVQTVSSPGGSDGKEPPANAGDPGSIPGSGRSSREGNGCPLQYSCLEKSMDREAWLQSRGLQD